MSYLQRPTPEHSPHTRKNSHARVLSIDQSQERLIVVANRLPVNLKKSSEGKWSCTMSSGGLVAALSALEQEYIWIGWPGADIPPSDRGTVTKLLWDEYSCIPVFLDQKLAEAYYNGFSNAILWPLFHYSEDFHFDEQLYTSYQEANREFAKVISAMAQKSDIVWVHDYHLMLLPLYLREALPQARIGFFLHIPFPSSEIYKALPVREEILEGILNSDLVGFHIFDYARHFMKSCTRILGLENTTNAVIYKNRTVPIGVFPVGIDPLKFKKHLETPAVKERIRQLSEQFKDQHVLIGIDRLDYIKGIPQKLYGMEQFFKDHPDYEGRVCLIQIAVPSRADVAEYQALKRQVDELTGSINSRYGGLGRLPIHYLYKSVDFTELCALYSIADGALITSLRDGMNLVSLEYIACQEARRGVLILSEFAGSGGCLNGTLRVNPYNARDISAAIYDAITMPRQERQSRHERLLKWVEKHTASYWGQSFVQELSKAGRAAQLIYKSPTLNNEGFREAYHTAKQRLLVITYDGTLIPFSRLPELAEPSKDILERLHTLARDTRNKLLVFSGRSQAELNQWFQDTAVGVVAENGYRLRYPNESDWRTLVTQLDLSWQQAILPVLKFFSERTPGSFVEEDETHLTWHYRNADPDFGRVQAHELQLHLDTFFAKLPITVESSKRNKTVEVRPREISLTAVVKKMLTDFGQIDFFLYVGEYPILEDLATTALRRERVFTCTVGKRTADTQHHLEDPREVLNLFGTLVQS